jgi:hypothetical protein
MKKTALFFSLLFIASKTFSQGTLSGNLMMNARFYQIDSVIDPNKITSKFSEQLKSGSEEWLSLRYSYKGFNAFLRLDAFQNSNLFDPKRPYTGFGIGAWSLSKEIKGLTITGGYIYDQIGTGLIFRSFEDRSLLIDNPILGLHLRYALNNKITLKAFAGQQKDIAGFQNRPNPRFEAAIKGFNAEGEYQLGSKAHIVPGIGIVARTLDDASMSLILGDINSQPDSAKFTPRYNAYAMTAYNMLSAGDFSWYIEGAYKTHEAAKRVANSETGVDEHFHDLTGTAMYTTLGYAKKGIAVNLTGKRTENFQFRSNFEQDPPRGIINYQPVVAKLRPQRLMSRYSPASQDISEIAASADLLVSPNDNLDFTGSATYINTLEDIELFREVYGEVNYRGFDKWILQAGVQVLRYNQAVYQVKPDKPMVEAVTPYIDVTYKIDDKKSIHAEFEYQSTEQDYGPWAFALIEFNIAPKWSFAASDMYTVDLNKDNLSGLKDPQHYYYFLVALSHGPHRISASYVRQVDGINCSGGICRYEPAFSGVRMTLTSTF